MAVAERGLVVLDLVSKGRAGHAAREEGENALYGAMDDITWFRNYKFEKVSDLLGPVKMSVTSIETENKAHNVVPAECRFIVDVRLNELYTIEEVVDTISRNVKSEVKPRSCRLRSTSIPLEHPLVKAGKKLGLPHYGSPTASDKALMPFPALKIGPGDSARSHTADEFIYLTEIRQGIELYIQLLNECLQSQSQDASN
jgi:acetylornithine deacetylase